MKMSAIFVIAGQCLISGNTAFSTIKIYMSSHWTCTSCRCPIHFLGYRTTILVQLFMDMGHCIMLYFLLLRFPPFHPWVCAICESEIRVGSTEQSYASLSAHLNIEDQLDLTYTKIFMLFFLFFLPIISAYWLCIFQILCYSFLAWCYEYVNHVLWFRMNLNSNDIFLFFYITLLPMLREIQL